MCGSKCRGGRRRISDALRRVLSSLTVSDNRWSCGRAIFQGNPVNKTNSPFQNNIDLEILDH